MKKGYYLDVKCMDCGDLIWNGFLTLRFPIVDKDGEVRPIVKCGCQENSPQYAVKYRYEDLDKDKGFVGVLKESYDIKKHFKPEDIAAIEVIEYGTLYICSERISEQEVEKRLIDRDTETYFQAPEGFDDEPEVATIRIEDILEIGWQDVYFKTADLNTLDEYLELMDTMNELFIFRYGEKKYRLLIQLSGYESKFPRYAVGYVGEEVKVEIVYSLDEAIDHLDIGEFESLFPTEEVKQEVMEALEYWLEWLESDRA